MADLRSSLSTAVDYVREAIRSPKGELDRWERAIRFVSDVAVLGAQQLRTDRAPQAAAALAYRTLFGLLPVLVLGTLLVRALGGFDRLEAGLAEWASESGLDEVAVQQASDAGAEAATSFDQWLISLVEAAGQLDLTAITWLGVLILVYSALGLMTTIEGCFNSICRAPEGRPWVRRVPLYWTVLTLGPAIIAVVFVVDRRVDAFLTDTVAWGWLVALVADAWGFVISWLLLFAAYKLVPNASVPGRSALAGAFTAAVLVALGRVALGFYVDRAISLQQLYGSLGLVPVFMFWVYAMWLSILFGLEVAVVLTRVGRGELDATRARAQREGAAVVDPAAVLLVAEVVAERFAGGRPARVHEVATEAGLPERTVATMLERLEDEGIVHAVGDGDGFSLALPPERIEVERLLAVGRSLAPRPPAGRGGILDRLREAEARSAHGLTLSPPGG